MWIMAWQAGRWWCPMCGDHSGWGMFWMGFFWVAVLAAIIVAVVALNRRTGSSDQVTRPRPSESPEQIIRRRYAAGEIDGETYRKMLEELGDSGR